MKHIDRYLAPTTDQINTYNGTIIVRHHFSGAPYQTGPRLGTWLAAQRKRGLRTN